MKRIITTALVAIAGFTNLGIQPAWSAGTAAAPIPTVAANTYRGATGRVINVELVVLEQNVFYNRLGAHLPTAQLYALARDVVPLDHPFDSHGNDADQRVDPAAFKPGEVRLRSYKRPRPVVLRANVGDTLVIRLRNLLPPKPGATAPSCDDKGTELVCAGLQIMGLQWADESNGARIRPGDSHTYRYVANEEGVFMLYSPNGQSIPKSQLDYGLFGAVNVQPEEAEWYRSQVTRKDLELATYNVSGDFMDRYWKAGGGALCGDFMQADQTGLPAGTGLRRKPLPEGPALICPSGGADAVWELRVPTEERGATAKIAEVRISPDGRLQTLAGQPVVDYAAVYPQDHPRAGSAVLNMLVESPHRDGEYDLAHSDLTAIITGPGAGRFPYYLNSPSFRENPATPDRRQPYREFSVMYHIAPNTEQAFAALTTGPLANTLAAGKDKFSINYGIGGIAAEIYANRTHLGPMGVNRDEVDLLFEEFFLSSWAVGDPAMIVDQTANNPRGARATKALYPDDPSNVYHSYMRDHVKFRVINTGSVAPHVHHQHAHQWLHSPDSDNGHYLDSQMISPGSSYTMEMTYNGSGNRNQTVGDSIFHCHIYPHFAQGMWALWRVHDVFEDGTELDASNRPLFGARALPDGEIVLGTAIPALVPLPTLGMAPLPAKVRLVDNGRRAEVIPDGVDSDGKPVYRNPGFPFFVPAVAGHRAPHPPMDFAWKENPDGSPMLRTANDATPFNAAGEPVYLNGGLPRHQVLGGDVAREFHTRWDFTKEVAVHNEHDRFIAGRMVAMEVPEQGTAAERAAMAAHATRTHATYQPDGLPGSFTLNGLPPVPGAPYAAPDVDDFGNSNFNARRYKAAVIQMDVVFNKQGWHYPQQRFITLLDDVKDTVSGKKPPEPFFFRSNTGETVEFWHTNLVPDYYELDDFQVRTPTDILGQHIHLVKFDVTSSDGAGNGFNYEDGTFSPDEVRERIDAINASGGLHHFDARTQFAGPRQSRLQVSNYREDYGDRLGPPPARQNWNGAQTTIQRFDTDPLLNNQSEDRTLRTVFTHDHFGPSTHQQAGLYGAMLVEPEGSQWKDAVTGCPMPADGSIKGCGKPRDDGGPTSWQAVIETYDRDDSFREFAIATADLQLAYTPESTSTPRRPDGVWFSTPRADDTGKDYTRQLDQSTIPDGLRQAFTDQGAILDLDAKVQVNQQGGTWTISSGVTDRFKLDLNGSDIDVRTTTINKGWADTAHAIWPPTADQTDAGAAPYPTIISDPGGSGNIGAWVANYRNEPLDARLQIENGSVSAPADHRTEDPAFAYASIQRGNPRLNRQPEGGSPIDPGQTDGFKYPQEPLLPEGSDGVGATDPYTPMLRAYAGDQVQVRTVVGAVDSLHSFRIQGAKWLAEPSFDDSGFRDTQGYGISEHYEMLFELPPAGAFGEKLTAVDYLYAPSSSSVGQAKGAWGILRAYNQPVGNLAALPNNPPGHAVDAGYYAVPEGATVRDYRVSVDLTSDATALQYTIDGGTPQSVLILRAAAGDWVRVTLTNNLTESETATLLTTNWGSGTDIKSGAASSEAVKPYSASAQGGVHPALVAYNPATSASFNVGNNPVQTVAPGKTRTYTWYAGSIDRHGDQRKLVPIEFGAVSLMPPDPLLQASYDLYGALIVEPEGATWDAQEAHEFVAVIRDADGRALFTEVVVVGDHSANASAPAGTEVRFRVLNPSAGGPGIASDDTRLIAVEGHNWAEEPYTGGSRRIGANPLSQTLGTQQITPLESYNLVLPQAGGVDKVRGSYGFYYYPVGPGEEIRLGELKVTRAD